MSAIWTNDGVKSAAELFLGLKTYDNLILRLFENNYTPVVTSTFSDFTECSLSGYAPVDLTEGSWSLAAALGVAVGDYPAILFSFDAYVGAKIIYGYYLTDDSDLVILADNITPAFLVPNGGGSVSITPTYADRKF